MKHLGEVLQKTSQNPLNSLWRVVGRTHAGLKTASRLVTPVPDTSYVGFAASVFLMPQVSARPR